MSVFAIIMFAATLYFAYQIFTHVQSMEDTIPMDDEIQTESMDISRLIDEADEAYQNGDLSTAQEKLEQAISIEPDNSEILNKLAFVHAKRDDLEGAIGLYSRSLRINENDDLTHNAIASLYRAKGSLVLAKEHYEKALEIDDAYAVTFYNYANLLVDLGENKKAEEMYQRAIELDSEMIEARDALESLRKVQ